MANSPLVSLRIPPEILSEIDELAEKLYPPRKTGGKPNRSQVILDAIANFLEQNQSLKGGELELEEKIKQILVKYQENLEKQIQSYIDEKFVAYAYNLKQDLRHIGKALK